MSTPIETNTEELQEILQTVYNLPNAGGGSSEPDLIVTINIPKNDGYISNITADHVTFDTSKIPALIAKLESWTPVSVVIQAKYYYGDYGEFTGFFYPTTVVKKIRPDAPTLSVGIECRTSHHPGHSGWTNDLLRMVLTENGTYEVSAEST